MILKRLFSILPTAMFLVSVMYVASLVVSAPVASAAIDNCVNFLNEQSAGSQLNPVTNWCTDEVNNLFYPPDVSLKCKDDGNIRLYVNPRWSVGDADWYVGARVDKCEGGFGNCGADWGGYTTTYPGDWWSDFMDGEGSLTSSKGDWVGTQLIAVDFNTEWGDTYRAWGHTRYLPTGLDVEAWTDGDFTDEDVTCFVDFQADAVTMGDGPYSVGSSISFAADLDNYGTSPYDPSVGDRDNIMRFELDTDGDGVSDTTMGEIDMGGTESADISNVQASEDANINYTFNTPGCYQWRVVADATNQHQENNPLGDLPNSLEGWQEISVGNTAMPDPCNSSPAPTATLSHRMIGESTWRTVDTYTYPHNAAIELNWTSTNATQCVRSSGPTDFNVSNTNGTDSTVTEPVAGGAPITYGVNCTNASGGSVTDSVQLSRASVEAAPTCTLTVNGSTNPTINSSQPFTIDASVSGELDGYTGRWVYTTDTTNPYTYTNDASAILYASTDTVAPRSVLGIASYRRYQLLLENHPSKADGSCAINVNITAPPSGSPFQCMSAAVTPSTVATGESVVFSNMMEHAANPGIGSSVGQVQVDYNGDGSIDQTALRVTSFTSGGSVTYQVNGAPDGNHRVRYVLQPNGLSEVACPWQDFSVAAAAPPTPTSLDSIQCSSLSGTYNPATDLMSIRTQLSSTNPDPFGAGAFVRVDFSIDLDDNGSYETQLSNNYYYESSGLPGYTDYIRRYLPTGSYRIKAVVDEYGHTGYGSTECTANIVVPTHTGTADMVYAGSYKINSQIDPSAVSSGQEVLISTAHRNQGDRHYDGVTGIRHQIDLDYDGVTFNADLEEDTTLGAVYIGYSLWTSPRTNFGILPNGTHALRVITDYNDVVYEGGAGSPGESNNESAPIPFTVGNGADFTPTATGVRVFSTNRYYLQGTVLNEGDIVGDLRPQDVKFKADYDRDGELDAIIEAGYSTPVQLINPGESVAHESRSRFTVPEGCHAYYVEVEDADDINLSNDKSDWYLFEYDDPGTVFVPDCSGVPEPPYTTDFSELTVTLSDGSSVTSRAQRSSLFARTWDRKYIDIPAGETVTDVAWTCDGVSFTSVLGNFTASGALSGSDGSPTQPGSSDGDQIQYRGRCYIPAYGIYASTYLYPFVEVTRVVDSTPGGGLGTCAQGTGDDELIAADEDGLADQDDPDCHTDGNVNTPGYDETRDEINNDSPAAFIEVNTSNSASPYDSNITIANDEVVDSVTWTCANATTVGTGGFNRSDINETNGENNVPVSDLGPNESRNYLVQCINNNLKVVDSVAESAVRISKQAVGGACDVFLDGPSAVDAGEPAGLTWTVTDPLSCDVSTACTLEFNGEAITGIDFTTGAYDEKLFSDTTFELNCGGVPGSKTIRVRTTFEEV